MSNSRFDMYQYRQIIFRLRQGESLRGIARAKLADRKKIRQIHKVSYRRDGFVWSVKYQRMKNYCSSLSQ